MKNDELVSILGKHLQQLRKERDLTLEQLAQKSGVSRSMLSQIERGQANPTFGTLWNLSHALGLEMSELVEEIETNHPSDHKIEHVSAENTPCIRNPHNGCTLRILSPSSLIEQFEWYELEIRPNGILDSQPHIQGCHEHLTVLSGVASVRCGDKTLHLDTGETARYRADVPHSIACAGNQLLRAILIVLN